jgi:signal transduction histidine kinase
MKQPVLAGHERTGPAHLVDDSLTLAERDLAYSNDWFIRLRWIAGAGVLIGAMLVSLIPKTGVPAIPLWVIGVGILLYNLAFFLIARRARISDGSPDRYRRLAYAQMIADWLAITFLVQFTGGIVSPLTFFYVFHVVIACMFFSPKTSFAFTFLAIFLFTTVVVLEYFSILPHYPIIAWRNYRIYVYQDPLYVASVWVFFSSTLIVLTYLASGRSERLRQREAEVLKLSEDLKLYSAKLQALNESARTVNSTLELGEVLNHLVTSTAHVMQVRACSIRLLDKTGKQLEPAAAYGLSQEYMGKGPIELAHSLLDREVLEGKVINIPDVRQSSLLQYPDWALQEGIVSMVSAPLIGKSGPLGILRAYADGRDRFTPDDEAFLSAIAAQGSIAIDNALAYQTIESLDATKAAFIRVFTHELRSPVSVIRSLLQTILSGYAAEINPQQRDILERAVRRVDFLRKLIDDLLDLANGRAPQQRMDNEAPIALEGVVEMVMKRFELPAREKGQTLEWSADPQGGESPVQATVESLDRIFNNLVSNAIRYTPEGGKVCVSLHRTAKEVMVDVADTGIGIPEEAMSHLFEEFFRAPNARAVEREGTGLGLSIVRETVNNLGGHVSVQSEVGVGTRFSVTLPLAERAEALVS